MNILLSLNIDQRGCLQIATEVDNGDIINLYSTPLSFYLKSEQTFLCLQRISVGYDLYYFAEKIQECLDQQGIIPVELLANVDLGLLWNKHWQKIAIAEDSGNPLPSWKWVAGDRLFLQANSNGFQSCNTFLYNDEFGNVVLQVSSAYPWFFKDAPSPDLEMSYEDWLPRYKILYKEIISKDVAQGWVKDLQGLYARLELNT